MKCYRPIYPVKAMTFDLDDTLYNNDPIIDKANQALSAAIQANYPATAALPASSWSAIKRELISTDKGFASDVGKLRYETLFRALEADKLSVEERHHAAQSLFDCFYTTRSDFKVSDEVHKVMARLAAEIPLIAITNGNVDTKHIGIDQYFSLTMHASMTRPSKPHPHMFEEAISFLKLKPHEVMHVGDNMIKDVIGAHRCGMQTAWIAENREMDLRNEPVSVLPSVQLKNLGDLLRFINS